MAAHHLSSDTPHIVTVPGQFPPAKVWHAMSPEKWNSLKKSQHLRVRIHSEGSMILPPYEFGQPYKQTSFVLTLILAA